MRSASVGFQCPECVQAGDRSVRSGRTALGGQVSADTSRVTFVLVALVVLVFLVGYAVPGLDLRFGNVASTLDPVTGQPIGVAQGQVYRLLTAAFLHAGLLHIGSNMIALLSLGPALEAALGRVRYLTLYVLSALGGSVLSFLVSSPGQFGVGASGAIFGLFGAYYVIVRKLGGDTGQIVGAIAINLVITFAIPIIDWRAHIGGLVTGSALAAAFAHAPVGPRRTQVQVGAAVAVAVLLAGAVLLRTAALS